MPRQLLRLASESLLTSRPGLGAISRFRTQEGALERRQMAYL